LIFSVLRICQLKSSFSNANQLFRGLGNDQAVADYFRVATIRDLSGPMASARSSTIAKRYWYVVTALEVIPTKRRGRNRI
jgi:hypothetical protein